MIKGIYNNAGAMVSLQTKQEVSANNLANLNTTGFKKDNVFRKYLIDEKTILQRNSTDFVNLEDIDEIATDFSQGNLTPTSNVLDTAIDGEGFFAVMTPDGPRYTRNGNFMLDNNSMLVTGNGYQVLGGNAPIQLAGSEIFIGDDGSISVDGIFTGRMDIYTFPDLKNLNKIGDGLFEAEPGTETLQTEDKYKLRQGYLEQANIETVTEMIEIIKTMRDFESNQKSIEMQDSTLEKAVNEVGRVN